MIKLSLESRRLPSKPLFFTLLCSEPRGKRWNYQEVIEGKLSRFGGKSIFSSYNMPKGIQNGLNKCFCVFSKE
jgi:hypothetical protein